jgi:hypothetical protein
LPRESSTFPSRITPSNLPQDMCRSGRSCSAAAAAALTLQVQAVFAKERAVVYRAYGDALAWSGSADAAAAVFARGVREGLWPHGPHCRPAKARSVVGVPTHVRAARELFPHVALPLESALATIQREFRDRAEGAADAWVQESAGLHSHGSTGAWHVLLLVVNGQPQQQGCALMPRTCALLLSLPSVRHLRDGQVNRALALVCALDGQSCRSS